MFALFVKKVMRLLKDVPDFGGIQKNKVEKMGHFLTVSYLSVDFGYVFVVWS
jgi:hypothetical protein